MVTHFFDSCLCCGSAAITEVFVCEDYTVSHEKFEIWQCNNCTFRFTQNVPGEANIVPYYRSASYVSHSDTKQGFVNRLYHIVRNITLQTKLQLVQNTRRISKGNLLDVGAGTGAFANIMKAAGWHVTGLEPDATARANAFANYNLQLDESSALHRQKNDSFDAITMWHVLEHVHDLHGYLQAFHRILKSSGRLIIAVPNYTSYDANAYNKYWAAYDVPRHLYHFSPKSMQVLLTQEGFMLEAVKPMWFDSFYISMLSEKYKTGSAHFIRAIWIGLMSNLKAFTNYRKCSSVIYVARKN